MCRYGYTHCLEQLGTLHQGIIHSPNSNDESEGVGLAVAGLIGGGSSGNGGSEPLPHFCRDLLADSRSENSQCKG